MALIIASMSRGSTVFFLFFHLELGLISTRHCIKGGICASGKGRRCVLRLRRKIFERDGWLGQRHFAMIPPLRTYWFDTGAVPRYYFTRLLPANTVIMDTFRRSGSGERIGSVLGMN